MITVYIPTAWLKNKDPAAKSIQEELDWNKVDSMNKAGYGAYFYPNEPQNISRSAFLKGKDFKKFYSVFIDVDFKQGIHDETSILEKLVAFDLDPTMIVKSGNGVHAYWSIAETENALLFLTVQRRLARYFNSDAAVAQLKQLMRLPGSLNTKDPGNFKPVEVLVENNNQYKIDDLDRLLGDPLLADLEDAKRHLASVYELTDGIAVSTELPQKFKDLLKSRPEIADKWNTPTDDRSGRDYRIACILRQEAFSKEEAISVMVNTEKALERTANHRLGYATKLIEDVWARDDILEPKSLPKTAIRSVKSIISSPRQGNFGARIICDPLFDNTVHGFRLGQVLGLIGGSGIGKTTLALNKFKWFAENNPQFDHLFVSLEQPDHEIAERMMRVAGGNSAITERTHILTNFDDNNNYRGLTLKDIRLVCKEFEKDTGRKLGCVVIDHIGALKGDPKKTEVQNIMSNSAEMKATAEELQIFLIMQSQAGREKAGAGDVELGKDAAYGSVYFESYCDWVVTLWQPLKRVYHQGAITCMAYKFAKKRHKNELRDAIKEDVPYLVYFNPDTEQLRALNGDELESINGFWQEKAIEIRNADRKTDSLVFSSSTPTKHSEVSNGTFDSDKNRGAGSEFHVIIGARDGPRL